MTIAIKKTVKIRINEIFYSIQGETTFSGLPTVFIRLTGCPLRCQYCDTAYAFHKGDYLTITEIMNQVAKYNPHYITVTGGEPLAQKSCYTLLSELCQKYETVSLETSGALCTAKVDPKVIKIIDVKTPGSGESSKNYLENFKHLSTKDQIKFVICSENDFNWSINFIAENKLPIKQIMFSPSINQMPIEKLADLILKCNIPIRLQTQLHKVIWGNTPGK